VSSASRYSSSAASRAVCRQCRDPLHVALVVDLLGVQLVGQKDDLGQLAHALSPGGVVADGVQHLLVVYTVLGFEPSGRDGPMQKEGRSRLDRVDRMVEAPGLGQQRVRFERPGEVVSGDSQVDPVAIDAVALRKLAGDTAGALHVVLGSRSSRRATARGSWDIVAIPSSRGLGRPGRAGAGGAPAVRRRRPG